MKDRLDPLGGLPPELLELDAELSALRYEERPSFAPELEAELAREWRALQGRRYWPVRQLLAAGFAGILMVGMGVPSARAALVRFVETLTGFSAEEVAPPQAPGPLTAPLLDAGEERVEGDAEVSVVPRLDAGPPPTPAAVESSLGAVTTFPELLDREWAEAHIRRNYPVRLQREGIGGTVGVLLWVDSTGAVDFVNLGRSSGIPELDRAALQVAPSLRFDPARRRGQAVGTWVEFDVRFQTVDPSEESDWLPELEAVDEPEGVDITRPDMGPEWLQGSALPAPGRLGAGDFLRSALGGEDRVIGLGTMEDLLNGDPPPGRNPTAWRAEASELLEEAIARAPDNPAPFLALSRIRRKQGLRTEAQMLLDRGLQRAQRNPGAISPGILADLHFERGSIVKERWLASRRLGRVRADVLAQAACPQARTSGGAVSGYASVERLIAWNYLCPEALGAVLDRAFESQEEDAAVDRTVTQASFRAAVEAAPDHVGANVEILLGLADEGRWNDVLAGARRFVGASNGDPRGLLMAGLALQRLSRSEEAAQAFQQAIQVLPPEDADQIQNIEPLLLEPRATEYRQLSLEEQGRWRRDFWAPLDPILATPVNERTVEHLARTSYALLRFGSTRSDPAEVWVRYGQPDRVRAFDENPDVRTEFWDFGPGPDLTFRRLAASNTMTLTPEGRAYLDEVRALVPHRYGNASRAVYALSAQVGRFRRQGGASRTEVEMHTRVPLLLATGGRDTLDVSLILLGSSGETLSVTLDRRSAVEGEISLEASAETEVRGVVVEVYNRKTGQAAALRRQARPLPAASGASMSDVILTFPASPQGEDVVRGAAWMEPLALDHPIQTHAIGAYVELYGLEGVSSWYRLRAEAVDRTTGDVRDLPIQPLGEGGFRATWDRDVQEGDLTREFVSIWLGDVPPGRYVLRLVADVPNAGAPLTAEQELDRR